MSPSEYAELVEFLGRQFTAIDGRFAAIDGRFAAIDSRFDRLEQSIAQLRAEMLGHFDEIYRRLERLEQEYQAILQALRRLEAGVAGERGRREILERDLAELKQQVSALQQRIGQIEERLERP
jgi:chromosome segregation ATPase